MAVSTSKVMTRRWWAVWLAAALILLASDGLRSFVNSGLQDRSSRASSSSRQIASRATKAAAPDALATEVQAAAAAAGTAAARREVRLRLLAAAASTCRGQCGSEADRQGALQLVKAMEALNPTPEPTKGLLEGKWRLIFASEDVTRSSPFFWGWRRMLEGIPDPSPLSRALFNTEELSESIFAFTDGIPLKNIGEATQTLYNGQIVNRVAVEIWGLGTTVMTTTCRYMPAEDPSELLLTVETTQAVDNTLPLADQVVFPSETFLGDNARLRARVTYLDEDLRIFRNELDDQVFVYVRA